MAFDSLQARKMVDLEYLLRYRNSKREDVFVGIDLLMYYTEGPFPQRVAPNVFVSFDVPSYPREIYRLAEEGKPPDWIIEVASPPTVQVRSWGQEGPVRRAWSGRVLCVRPARRHARSAPAGVGTAIRCLRGNG